MGWWLTTDVPLVYLFKRAIRVFHFFKSIGWERSRAPVISRAICVHTNLNLRFSVGMQNYCYATNGLTAF